MNDKPAAGTEPAELLPELGEYGWRIEQVARANGELWVTAGADTAVAYPASGHELMGPIEELSPWYRERSRLVAAALAVGGLPDHLVEVGAGNGAVAAHLRQLGVDAVAVEPVRAGASRAADRGVPTVCGMLTDLALPDGALQAVAALDVLEHLPDPASLILELRRVLRPGGRLIVTVPAMPSLWSQADELAGHYRRYTRSRLISELANGGLEVDSCRYAFGALVPAAFLLRALPHRLGRRRSREHEAEVGTRQVAGYGRLRRRATSLALAGERSLRRVLDPPIGSSLVAIFIRPR